MPIRYKEELVSEQKIIGFQCNKCKTEFLCSNDQQWIDLQEFIHLKFRGGYGSVFGDGNTLELVLCQHCAQQVFGEYLEYIENRSFISSLDDGFETKDFDEQEENVFRDVMEPEDFKTCDLP